MRRGGETGPGILLALRSAYETEGKKKETKEKKAEEEKQAKGLGFRSLFRSFINPPP